MKKFSLIISTLNCADVLDNCLNSIRAQSYRDFELIIVDGLSEDNTAGIVRQYSDIVTTFLSEKDTGIYDAWNKGLLYAKGEWIYFLGADDLLKDRSTLATVDKFLCNLDADIPLVYGKVLFRYKDGSFKVLGKRWNLIQNKMKSNMAVPHQGVFHSLKFLKMINGFDARLSYAADYKMLLQASALSNPIFMEEIIVAEQSYGGKTSIPQNRLAVIKEYRLIQKEMGIFVTCEFVIAYLKAIAWKVFYFTLRNRN
jgi:glycosyltransferase involved in cell wall biosynthesis